MNINLRAIVFGAAVAAALTVTMNTVAAEHVQVVRLDTVQVVAHRDHFDADGNLKSSYASAASDGALSAN